MNRPTQSLKQVHSGTTGSADLPRETVEKSPNLQCWRIIYCSNNLPIRCGIDFYLLRVHVPAYTGHGGQEMAICNRL